MQDNKARPTVDQVKRWEEMSCRNDHNAVLVEVSRWAYDNAQHGKNLFKAVWDGFCVCQELHKQEGGMTDENDAERSLLYDAFLAAVRHEFCAETNNLILRGLL